MFSLIFQHLIKYTIILLKSSPHSFDVLSFIFAIDLSDVDDFFGIKFYDKCFEHIEAM